MKNKLFSAKHAFIFLFLIAALISAILKWSGHQAPGSAAQVAERAEKKLQRKDQRIIEKLNRLAALPSAKAIRDSIFNEEENNLVYSFAYIKDSLFAWSDNDVSVSPDEADSLPNGSLIKLRNGWYELYKLTKGDYHFYSALLIKHEFAYQNKFLVNSFNYKLEIPDNYEFNIYPAAGAFPVKNSVGRTLFYLSPPAVVIASGLFSWNAWLCLLVFILLILGAYSFGRWLLHRSFLPAVLFSFVVIGLRLLMIRAQLPDVLYATDLFKPLLYASYKYMNSLGDFLFNVLTVLSLLLVFVTPMQKPFTPLSTGVSRVAFYLLLLVVLFASALTGELIQGIVFNSSINFNTVNFFDLNSYSFTGLFIVAVLMFIFFLLVKRLADFQAKANVPYAVPTVLAVCFIIIVGSLYSRAVMAGAVALFALLYLCICRAGLVRSRSGAKGFGFGAVVIFLFLTALYSCLSIYIYSDQKEKENRKLLAGKIETAQDRIAEHLFEDVQNKISTDSILQSYFTNPASAPALISQRLRRRYFNGFWTKYETDAYCFDSLNRPLNKSLDSLGYYQFEEIIAGVSKPTYADDLFFLTNAKGKSLYLAKIPLIGPDSSKKGTLFVELEPKLIQATTGFPELFISDKVVFNKDMANYSYARYRNNELINQYGDFAYYSSPAAFGDYGKEYFFMNSDGYNHLLYRENTNNLIVISKKQDTAYTLITSISYFFVLFSVLLLLLLFLYNLVRGNFSLSLTLKNRIQLSVIAVVVFSVGIMGLGTIYYIVKKYDNNQNTTVSNKLKLLLVTLENNFGEQINPDSTLSENTIVRLTRLSGSSATDFNWYDEEGNLLFSSQPKIFDQGIISTLMNPKAFNELTAKEHTQYVHPENIGKLNYIAAYQTLRNRQNQLCGYISLPFFEKENELNKEISSFLSALINIYMVLLALTVLVTFFIASRITKPLLLIQEKLANINLGKQNEYIQWSERDEIGGLVKEYNKKVAELAESAELLAQSERESAWQEMAKQVAHEIKNPLTPMKLGVQHLLNAYKNNAPDKEELVKKISQTLIQQIDTLSNIANEFSNFAKMPQAKNETVDLISIISDTINLFKESPGVTISCNKEIESESAEVFADKDQIIRVFSNLLKNAVQSIPSERAGKIEVWVTQKGGFFTVSIKDNGTGIADNQLEKIFTPNFTTKSGGTGLGLAMVKNIVENSGGKVWFETKIGAGTTFFVSLPAINR